ncbi:hypothetical protein F8M41_007339 [Gigaspora margarita]|uniref:Ras-GEF domain-containing protein n=1 Tax=Gigaspora margarita TaxID=4874 RepID=A0A8H3X524_GIGMA|nr:hypothetical protein F8M41_007339 [Gigaspora margarita]
MSSWENLINTAAADYNNGNFRESYNNYLKVANALLYKFNQEVAFSSKEAVKSKPPNSARLFQNLRTCVQRLEDILQNKAINGVSPAPQHSAISDNAALILSNSHSVHLPLVPFSPLTRQSIHHAHLFAIASQRLSVAEQKLENKDKEKETILRKLRENFRQQQSKLDQVNSQIQSIAEVTLLHWDAEAIAQQLTIIDYSLFNNVEFKKDFSAKDKKNSKLQACMDFHRYLTNSFVHQFIYADMARTAANSSRGVQHPRESIIPHAIRVALYLLHVHRNFNSFAALVKALTSPEVRRIRRLWSNIPSRFSHLLSKELSPYVKKDNDYKAYREILAQKMESFRGVGEGTIVIPWMQPHYEEIRSITQSYTSGKSGDSSEIILSAPGARKLTSISALLKQCKTNTVAHDDEEWNEIRKPVTSSQRHRDTITVDGVTITLPTDLSRLGCGDLGLHHWLVSRVYLTKRQLIDESIEIEPLGENEQLPCEENDYEEEEEEDDDVSVGQLSDDGDNLEIGSSSKHVFASSSTPSLTKVSQDNSGEQSNEALESSNKPSSSKEMIYASKNEQTTGNSTSTSVAHEIPKTVENGKPVGKSLEETPYNLEPVKNDSATGLSNGKIEESATSFGFKSDAIPIPQVPKETQPIVSPKNLNPNAPVFIPKSLNSSLLGDKINVSLKQLEEKNKNHNPGTETLTTKDENDDDVFIYCQDNKLDDDNENEFFYPEPHSPDGVKDSKENEDDVFMYPFDPSPNESTENDRFVYPENSPIDNKKDNVAKNGIGSVITTKVENGGVPEVTIKFHHGNGTAVSKDN